MERVFINIEEALKKVLPETLQKDLQENERICTTCHGLGVVKADRVFGLKGDTSEIAKTKTFPYNHATLTLCPDCYNGVQRLCEYCGKPIHKVYIDKCDCEQYKAKEEAIRQEKWQEVLRNAEEVKPEDVKTMLYCVETDSYYNEVEDFFDDWESNHEENEENEEIPERLWVTEEVNLSFSAENILEDACNDLHEDALDNCNIDELQELLDDYAEKQTGAKTYFPCFKKYVTIKNLK